MDLYPAIDIRDGEAVRLTQGDFDRQTGYGDPVELALAFVAGGAPWLHVVDLDAARLDRDARRRGDGQHGRPVDRLARAGGGVRTLADVDALLDGGIARVVLGTAAIDDPQLVRAATAAHPGRVALGLDYRTTGDGRAEVAVRGWEQGSGRSVGELLDEVTGAGLTAVIVTAIERDGMLTGPDLDGLHAVLASTEVPVIASGGVGSVADVEALAALAATAPDGTARRLAGAITGKALVDGRLTVAEGVAACARFG